MTPGTFLALTAGLFAFGALLMRFGQSRRNADRGRRRSDWIKYAVYVGVIGILLGALTFSAGCARVLVLGIAVGGAREIWANVRTSVVRRLLASVAFGVAAAVCLLRIVTPSGSTIVLLVATCDAFSQLWGRWLGRRPMAPRISPAKTLEGLVGGMLTTVAVAAIVGHLHGEGRVDRWMLLGAAVAAAATSGDLLFSWTKRHLGIKDFASTLPGHGGLLDRFDSLIVAAPAGVWLAGWLACR
jgi:CDP-diglyceride synthetase